MEKHIKILGILFIASGVLGILVGLLILFLFTMLGAAGFFADMHRPMVFAALLNTIGWLIAALTFIFGIPEIIAGWGLLKKKKWSRILGIIMAFFELLSIPIGTALGIYALWVLFSTESEKSLTA